jgi:hypothetical protein
VPLFGSESEKNAVANDKCVFATYTEFTSLNLQIKLARLTETERIINNYG